MNLINPFWYAAAAPATDPFWANVVLLMHFDGANGSNTFVNSSQYTHTFAASPSGITNSTAQQKFGTASCLTTLAGSYTNTPDSADWHFGAGQFTVEAFIRPTAAITDLRTVVSQWQHYSNASWALGFNAGVFGFFYSTTGADVVEITATYAPTLNQWVHVAADRDASNVLRVYVNGTVLTSATAAVTFFNSTRSLVVSNDEFLTRGFPGYIDELRITKGVARYHGAFTPPTAAFPDA